jgi:hypothetical protein
MTIFRTKPRFRRLTVIPLIGIVLVLILNAAPADAQSYSPVIPFPWACGSCVMNANETLTDSGWLVKMQGDGNLVMRNSRGTACFASNTAGHSGAHVAYQTDGNFVVYATSGTALWSSHTAGKWIGPTYNVSIHAGWFYVGNTLIHGPC